MRRRDFLQYASVGGAAILIGTAAIKRAELSRRQMVEELTERVQPILARKSGDESQRLPAEAREKIRVWFHGPCLNSPRFAQFLRSRKFAVELANFSTEEDRQKAVVSTFTRMVVSEDDILSQVQKIADKIGSKLDTNWDDACQEISDAWNFDVNDNPRATLSDDLRARLVPLIQRRIDSMCALSRAAGQHSLWAPALTKIGSSAIMLLRVDPRYGIPIFMVVALASVLQCVKDHQIDSIKFGNAISKSVANLGNDVGDAFEKEMGIRISELHNWQKSALLESANEYAKTKIPLLG